MLMATWSVLPAELAEIEAELAARTSDAYDPEEDISEVEAHHVLRRRYTEVAGRLGICNTSGCLQPKQPDAPWCARDAALARQILAEILADEAVA